MTMIENIYNKYVRPNFWGEYKGELDEVLALKVLTIHYPFRSDGFHCWSALNEANPLLTSSNTTHPL